MNFSSSDLHSLWDLSAQQPDTFSALPDDDFLAFLQKQFPTAGGNNPPLSFDNPDGVDPQSISSFPPLNNSPPSSDSSPSPPSTHNEASLSRRQSGAFNSPVSSTPVDQQKGQNDDGSLKRKANNDTEDDEPQHKSQHTSSSASNANNNKKGGSSSSRRKSGTPQDEIRLLKRKEQNRAAQRAFRERKERHVKDLEDKVAALEAKNHMTEQENENLRDLLQRLQNENMMLKQAAFTFTAPRSTVTTNATPAQNTFGNNQNMQFNFASPGAGPSKPPVQSQPQQSNDFGIDFNNLIPFDPNTLNPTEDFADMNVDTEFPFSGSYKTIASNPMFTSFAEPSPSDSPPLLVNSAHQFTPGSFDSFTEQWTPPEANQDALEQLFGANFLSPNNNTAADFQAILASSPSSISPVSHASMRTPSLSSASSSPAGATGQSTPQTANGSPAMHHMGECPKTKEQLSKAIAEQGQSSFVKSPTSNSSSNSNSPSAASDSASPAGAACEMPFAPFLKKAVDDNGTSPIVMCKGSSFPRTEKSDKNVEVLTAWRSITSNPQFKDVDINELCSEFTSKARCDGTKVVLEPEGVHHIIETLAAKQAQK
ncbi:hypothetical protein PYCCODRAFT_1361875 [Trametes coccinea BRFM310]|uniref:BZIP domain-containing protein n=1 Tax=Trametes coccinea (strain BRFM310) TaxID=1353009 RepID=A0A1Y2J0D4_TRAC3|nr:hypothetical protein PYCCODRAFT_1361875 [Trametes coccinea BRFM310]